ncbi:3'-5' exonuclease [Azospirillum lipoferum]|uniref:DNA 3'-5' helicase n=1 Tax=Azospirillum lipoferum (strain 4B) TaxID=862719 RepID=G7Z1X7_AZOL4|nr:3'-5' exonuclease [Azospirillum lipoferum]CBS87327.1 Putative DNA helicase UvrD-like [Azospirillum lipoferum 4B]
MEFRIAETFTQSLARLPAKEQKAAKTTAFDLQIDPSSPGLKFHRVERSRDPHFWTVRVNDDLRIVVHKTDGNFLLCYVDRHDDAYGWAEKRRIEAHPTTGAAQFVEFVHHVVEETAFGGAAPRSGYGAQAPLAPAAPGVFDQLTDETLLRYGVPPDWLDWIRQTDEDGLFDLEGHLPQEALEALLELAVGGKPAPPVVAPPSADPFAHPDAQRRFRTVANVDELRQALESPWDKWTVFLHPSQRELVERRYGGPARVTGSAGTGKTVVALHRAVHLARRSDDARVLLATFSKALAQALKVKLSHLLDSGDPAAGHITVTYVDGVAHRLFEDAFGVTPNIASVSQVEAALTAAAKERGETRFSHRFLVNEWRHVVDAWQLRTWEAYRDVSRLGRRTRIGGNQREALWALFERAQAILKARNVVTWAEAVARVAEHHRGREKKPFTAAVIDEAQDISIPQLRFLAALVPDGPDALFFAGDLGQRIFQQPFSWLSQGVDVRGRSSTLKVNYRTSHQIRRRADLLLPAQVRDVDGVEDQRKGTISVFDGPEPDVGLFDTAEDETAYVAAWIAGIVADGVAPEEVGIFVRTSDQIDRAKAAAKQSGHPWVTLQDRGDAENGRIAIGTMHLAKGLEFKAVVVMACDDEVMPLQERIESASEESELDEIFETERHLLYVACTRARDRVCITGVEPGSEFLADLLEVSSRSRS